MLDSAAWTGDTPPRPRTRLIGREIEYALATTRLGDEAVPVLTLTGPGGAGKTRLALAIAHALAPRFTHGAIWVELAPLADPALVPATVARALGIVPVAGRPVDEQLIRALRSRQSLLVLDNCEHLLDAAADFAAAVLRSCPDIQMLVTSRAPLRLRGEQEFPVEPFPLPSATAPPAELATNAAVRLFVERAHAVDPRFALTADNAATVAALCRCLDGLPLAIELAAARAKMLSPTALLAQMGDRLRLLRGGARDLPARQQTMRDTIAWSYALLDPGQRALFRQLAVFAGGWTLAAAVAVAGDRAGEGEATPAKTAEDMLDDVQALVDHSLVRRVEGADAGAGDPRFTMLETIREFGLAELAAAGEDAEVRSHHARWVRALVEELDLHQTMRRDAGRIRLLPEQDNVRQALAWFAAQGDALALHVISAAMAIFWPTVGQFAEARAWLQRATVAPAGVPLALQAHVWHEAGWLAMAQGEVDTATQINERALDVARVAGDPYLLAEVMLSAGMVAFWRGDLARAAALVEEGQHAFEALDPAFASAPIKATAAVNLRGNIVLVSGDHQLAVQLGVEAVRRARAIGAPVELGYALCGQGYAQLLAQDVPAAAASILEALAVTWPAGDDVFRARLLWAMAAVGTTVEQVAVAIRLIGVADTLDARTGAAPWPADTFLVAWCLARLQAALAPAEIAAQRRAAMSRTVSQAAADVWLITATVLGEEQTAAIWHQTGTPDPRADDQAPAAPPLDLAAADPPPGRQHLAAVEPAPRSEAADGAAPPRRTLAGAPRPELTPRERDVLVQLIDGRTDREIAEHLYISRRTVSKHVESILTKLEVRTRGAAVAEAIQQGLTTAPPAGRDR